MARLQRSTAIYPHPFSRAYWRDAASELTFTKMLVVTALMTALRIALKPLAIPLGPSLNIQTAMLATALGAMLYGPVVAIPAAIISDTIGFLIWPTGDYFLPFVLTEIASTMIYSLCLYRSKVTPTRVILSRFLICFLVNVVLQQLVYGWYYLYIGSPEKAMNAVMGIMTTTRIIKNLVFFPIESLVLCLFLKVLLPVTQLAKLTFCSDADMRIKVRDIIILVCLLAVGITGAVFYLTDRYQDTSRSADYTDAQRVDANQNVTEIVLENVEDLPEGTIVCIVDSAYRPLFGETTDYTVSVYLLDEAAFAAGQAADKDYDMDTLWGYSKSGPGKDPYGSLVKLGTATFTVTEKTDAVSDFVIEGWQSADE